MKTATLKNTLSCVLAAAVLFSAMPLYAQYPEGEAGKHKKSHQGQKDWGKEKDKLMKELGITPEQQEQMKKQRQESREKTRELMTQMRAKQQELRQELEKYNSDKDKVAGLASELKGIQAQLIDLRISKITMIKSILTQEQFEKFKDKTKTHFKNRFGKRRGDKKCMPQPSQE